MTDLRGHIAETANRNHVTFNALERLADEAGVGGGERADDRQLAYILARLHGWVIEQPELSRAHADSGGGAAQVARGGDGSSGRLPAPSDTPPEVSEPVSATEQAETSPASPAPAQEKLPV